MTVLRDNPVSFAMALLESLSRNFMRLTLPIISMVITLLYLLKYSAGQWNTLVNFGAALLALGGQFSVGVNTRGQMERLSRDIGEVFEIRASSEHAAPVVLAPPRRVFISHGRAKDWYEVQSHIEKDLKLDTLELAQEPSRGQTVIEKLEMNSGACDVAVIVMSGDDTDEAGQVRTRENVMHETGYFQARYGRHRVVLLHEDGVNVPSNLGGIVYVPYPTATPSAAFGLLDRELKAIYGL